jgi:2-polyprenyl-3-methyl-5-hydroxy-6-metoxy-1,4-benzoquinol methylase
MSYDDELKIKGKLLEIGCSVGFFLEEAKKYNFITTGLELNKNAAESCLYRGLNIKNCSLTEAKFEDGLFDVVVMSHVLEHIADIKDFLKEVHRVIKPGGYIVLSQPNYQALVPGILKQDWYGWVPADHFWHFTPKSITYVLRQNGFELESVQINSMYYPFDKTIKNILIALIARIAGLLRLGDQFYVAARKI